MRRLDFYIALLFLLMLRPLQAEKPAEYQKRAARALEVEMAQIGQDCSSARNTLESNSCLMAVQEKTQNHFREFYESLRGLLYGDLDAVRQLDNTQALWEKYSNSACEAIDAFYRTGSIRVSAVEGCHIQLTRGRMRDLAAVYYNTLHN